MIARSETPMDKVDIWSALAAPLPPAVIEWRQDGRPMARDGRHVARFVAYITANVVLRRLDAVVPGEWDLHLEPLPTVTGLDEDANMGACNFKARLQILGVIREDVGTGKDWKQASTDAFKRTAVRFGIGAELYDMEHLWVQMDGDGKYAKPIEDPAVAYARKHGRARPTTANSSSVESAPAQPSVPRAEETESESQARQASEPRASDEPMCPKCDGRMWDNRLTKRNPKAPDFKCRDRACDGVIWPPKPAKGPVDRAAEEVEEIPF